MEIRDRVAILDWMPHRELPALLDRHGLLLFPSFVEGFGRVFVEAMARGLVVVASRQGGARDLLADGAGGILVPVGSADAMIRAAGERLSDLEGSRRISAAAAELARRLDWATTARDAWSPAGSRSR